jgi:hypothetical protein
MSRRPPKRTPHYSLADIKAFFSSATVIEEHSTGIARRKAREAGAETTEDVLGIVQSTKRSHFYHSMPSDSDYTIWQDVYHVPFADIVLYVKFTKDHGDFFLLISCKDRDEE